MDVGVDVGWRLVPSGILLVGPSVDVGANVLGVDVGSRLVPSGTAVSSMLSTRKPATVPTSSTTNRSTFWPATKPKSIVKGVNCRKLCGSERVMPVLTLLIRISRPKLSVPHKPEIFADVSS